MAIVRGYDCELTIGNEVTRATDVSLTRTRGSADGTTRGAKGTEGGKEPIALIPEWTASFDMVLDSEDTVFTALETAYDDGSNVTAIFERPSGGATKTGTCWISDLDESEPLNDVVKISVKLQGVGVMT